METRANRTDRGESDAPDLRARILAAASRLMAEQGVTALTTRAVATAAGVQAPALYRLFGDKRGLLHAVAEYDLVTGMSKGQKAAPDRDTDPVRDLARGWDQSIAFGLANPAVFAIVNELGAQRSPATIAGLAGMREQVEKIARIGRLGVPVARAVELIHSAGVGTIAGLLAVPVEDRDPTLAPAMRDAVIAAILAESAAVPRDSEVSVLALTLGAKLDEVERLTPGERLILSELLDRLASGASA